MHKTLQRQLRHCDVDNKDLAPEMEELLQAVSATYGGFDKDRLLIERSLDISSAELKDLISLLQVTLNSTDDGVLVIDTGNTILHHNQRLLEVLKISEAEIVSHDAKKVMNIILNKVINKTLTAERIYTVLNNPEKDSHDTVEFIDGRIIEMYSKPQILDGRGSGRVWRYRDVTKRVTTEAQLKKDMLALARLNKIMVDRELKMVELKTKIKMLEELNYIK
jgi:PAS domain S-box-containing protein